jgi:hypothetical protein
MKDRIIATVLFSLFGCLILAAFYAIVVGLADLLFPR